MGKFLACSGLLRVILQIESVIYHSLMAVLTYLTVNDTFNVEYDEILILAVEQITTSINGIIDGYLAV